MRRSDFIIRFQNNLLLMLGVVILVVFSGYTLWNEQGLMRLFEMHQEQELLHKENNELIIKNYLIHEQIQRMQSKDAIEQAARSQLGRVRPNEIIYVVE